VVCGGTDAAITPVIFAGLAPMGAMSQRNDDLAGACRPFDADRDGFVFGEGAVVAVVESVEHAARMDPTLRPPGGQPGGIPEHPTRRRRARSICRRTPPANGRSGGGA
jgi:beta-ketoacyl synthase-like protein